MLVNGTRVIFGFRFFENIDKGEETENFLVYLVLVFCSGEFRFLGFGEDGVRYMRGGGLIIFLSNV